MSLIFDEQKFFKEFKDQKVSDELTGSLSKRLHEYEIKGIKLDTLILITFISVISLTVIKTIKGISK